MPNNSAQANNSQPSSNKLLIVAILLFALILAIFFWLQKENQKGGERNIFEKPSEQVVNKGRDPERIDRDEEEIKTEAQMKEDEITIINAEGVKVKMGLDTSTKYRLAVLDFLKKSLRDFGYTMTINNLASITDQLKPVIGQEDSFVQTECGQYRIDLNQTTKKINIFYYVSNSYCPEVFIMRPVQNVITKIGGGRDYWRSGTKAIFDPEGLTLQADDSPFVTVDF